MTRSRESVEETEASVVKLTTRTEPAAPGARRLQTSQAAKDKQEGADAPPDHGQISKRGGVRHVTRLRLVVVVSGRCVQDGILLDRPVPELGKEVQLTRFT